MIRDDFKLNSDEFNSVLFTLKLVSKDKCSRYILESLREVSPEVLCNLVKYSNPYTWFASTIYEEMLKRYETISYILSTENDPNIVEKLIRIYLGLQMELRPLNNETLKTTVDVFREKLMTGRSINLISLTCPAYTIGREGIAENLIQNRIKFFIDLTSKSIGPIKELISEWHIYAWDSSGLNDPILRKTIHPKLLRSPTLEAQLNRSWNLFYEATEMICDRLKIKVILKKYKELQTEIYTAKDVLEKMEKSEKFLSKCIQRILKHGKEDYKKMGEDIEEHKERFWNDSYIYTGAILKYGIKNNAFDDLPLMISIESRIHHITGLRLYHFEYENNIYLMPVWNYPTWIRSFYWVNKGNEDTDQKILDTLKRWKRYKSWEYSWSRRTIKNL